MRDFYTCEFTTVNSKGQPITWPSVVYYDEVNGLFTAAVSIAFPVKALNARRNPRVSLLYSEPTGSRIENPPAVLVQGDAVEVSEVLDFPPQIIGLFKLVARRQPDSSRFSSSRLARKLFGWYLYQRISITIRPRRLLVWSGRDFTQSPAEIEVSHVER
jgi:hypothetical protein